MKPFICLRLVLRLLQMLPNYTPPGLQYSHLGIPTSTLLDSNSSHQITGTVLRAGGTEQSKTWLLSRPMWASLLIWPLTLTPWLISELLLFRGGVLFFCLRINRILQRIRMSAPGCSFGHFSHTSILPALVEGFEHLTDLALHFLTLLVCESLNGTTPSIQFSHFSASGPTKLFASSFPALGLPWMLATSRTFSYPWQIALLLWLTCA